MKETMIHREEEEELQFLHFAREKIGVIQRSTSFERERFFMSSGDADDDPEAKVDP